MWTNLIRFVSNDRIFYGDAILDASQADQITDLAHSGRLEAFLIEGIEAEKPNEVVFNGSVSSTRVRVDKLLSPLVEDQVGIIRCIGLNYMKHMARGGRTPPPFPSLFVKPSTALATFDGEITIPKVAQKTLDYEAELTIVIGKNAVNITEDVALDYIAGYLVANDLSCRQWQRDPKLAGSVPQWCFSKGFDGFSPIGPMIVSPAVLGKADNLRLRIFVNGDIRQDSNTADMLFGTAKLVSFLSQGTTLRKGSLIMTGTPSGVAMRMKPEPVWLRDGDRVVVAIERLGRIENTMRFDRTP